LQAISGDGHLAVEFSGSSSSKLHFSDIDFGESETQRIYGAHINYGIKRVEWLESNIGLLDLRVFPPLRLGGASLISALSLLENTRALVIDLRHNGGGHGEAVSLIASFLVDDIRPLSGVYSRPLDLLTSNQTYPYTLGKPYGKAKPVYVLISRETFSASEALAYDLQALGRVTVVGETSGGGANPFEYKRIHPQFVLWSVTEKSVNPITGSNWQGTGVVPDIMTQANSALQRAVEYLQDSPAEGIAN